MINFTKDTDLIFKLTIVIVLMDLLSGIIAVSLMYIPPLKLANWTEYDWNMVKFFWIPTLRNSCILVIFSIFLYRKKDFIFPILFLYWLSNFSITVFIVTLEQIFTRLIVYPLGNTRGIIIVLELILSILGTIIWIQKISNKNRASLE